MVSYVAANWAAVGATPAEGSGSGMALVYLVVALGYILLLGPLALLIGRDARRRSRNGWAWA
jgi:hypothetical protein